MFKPGIIELCRELRRNETEAEKQLWALFRGRQFSDFKFRRQHPFIYQKLRGTSSFFIADFYCAKRNLIIELNGKIHDYQKDYDQNRDEILSQLGLTTIRVKNELLENDFSVVSRLIFENLNT